MPQSGHDRIFSKPPGALVRGLRPGRAASSGVTLFSGYLGLQTLGLLLPATMIAVVVLDLTMVPAMAQLGWLEPRR